MKEYLRKETSTLIFQLLKIEMHCIHWKFINARLKIWFRKELWDFSCSLSWSEWQAGAWVTGVCTRWVGKKNLLYKQTKTVPPLAIRNDGRLVLASYLLIEMIGIIFFEKGQNISSKLKRTNNIDAIILSKSPRKLTALTKGVIKKNSLLFQQRGS